MEGEDVDYLEDYYIKEFQTNPIASFLSGYNGEDE